MRAAARGLMWERSLRDHWELLQGRGGDPGAVVVRDLLELVVGGSVGVGCAPRAVPAAPEFVVPGRLIGTA